MVPRDVPKAHDAQQIGRQTAAMIESVGSRVSAEYKECKESKTGEHGTANRYTTTAQVSTAGNDEAA
jgi:hypothetical protein